MDNYQITSGALDGKDLKLDSGSVVTENQHAVRLTGVIGRRLNERQAAMSDGESNLVIGDSMLVGGLENPDRQRLTP